ncbi:hypothetical protein ACFPIJ_00250 [Dactylosporangium cerinum]|uniref:Uncharacterized protein n=1 Tax=Dactylosporangium cerinum TaxID=1434730 RepID=A0ABV9VKX2_9ACTN
MSEPDEQEPPPAPAPSGPVPGESAVWPPDRGWLEMDDVTKGGDPVPAQGEAGGDD